MIYAILSILVSFIIAFGRQISVFGKIESGLWFFSKFKVRIWSKSRARRFSEARNIQRSQTPGNVLNLDILFRENFLFMVSHARVLTGHHFEWFNV